MFVHEEGLLNISEGIIKQAHKDFVNGMVIIYSIYGDIIPEKEAMKIGHKWAKANSQKVRWGYDAWRFIIKDPYDMFGTVGDSTIIKSWSNDAIAEYYKEDYICGKLIESMIRRKIIKDDSKYKSTMDRFEKALSKIKEVDRENLYKNWEPIIITRMARKKYPNPDSKILQPI